MRLTLIAVGRQKQGPERDLCAHYCARAEMLGRNLGISPVAVTEIDPKGATAETEAVIAAVPDGALVIALDERGEDLSSDELARLLAAERDEGRREIAFLIGGADGLAPRIRARADRTLRFGRQTWPHMLVRVMAMEQIYRAVTILAGHPYHRGA